MKRQYCPVMSFFPTEHGMGDCLSHQSITPEAMLDIRSANPSMRQKTCPQRPTARPSPPAVSSLRPPLLRPQGDWTTMTHATHDAQCTASPFVATIDRNLADVDQCDLSRQNAAGNQFRRPSRVTRLQTATIASSTGSFRQADSLSVLTHAQTAHLAPSQCFTQTQHDHIVLHLYQYHCNVIYRTPPTR